MQKLELKMVLVHTKVQTRKLLVSSFCFCFPLHDCVENHLGVSVTTESRSEIPSDRKDSFEFVFPKKKAQTSTTHGFC